MAFGDKTLLAHFQCLLIEELPETDAILYFYMKNAKDEESF